MSDLARELKALIISSLNLEHLTPDDIGDEVPLFDEGLGLDSIDALELGLAIKKNYNIVLDEDDEKIREHFASVSSLVRFISANGK